MVGDLKQSIYRFRHADLSIFHQYIQETQYNSKSGRHIVLVESFRSRMIWPENEQFIWFYLERWIKSKSPMSMIHPGPNEPPGGKNVQNRYRLLICGFSCGTLIRRPKKPKGVVFWHDT